MKTDIEEWKSFPLNTNYLISTFGNVKTIDRITTHGLGFRNTKSITVKQRLDVDGYLNCNINQIRFTVHTLVGITYLNKTDETDELHHIDFIRTNNRLDNLKYLTHNENIKLTVLADRHSKGERNGMHKLMEIDVINIKHLLTTTSMTIISKKYKVCYGLIKAIKYNRLWKHVQI